jgi:Protein of unknown function (DUF3108)
LSASEILSGARPKKNKPTNDIMNIRNRFLPVISFLTLSLMSFSGTQRQEPQAQVPDILTNPCQSNNTAFQAGEKITYVIYYNWNFVWLAAGEVTFTVADAGSQFHITASGETYDSYEWMYSVKDRFETYVDKTTGLPRVSVRDVKEGKYSMYEKTELDQPKRKAFSLKGKNKAAATKRQDFVLDDCMHDILSVVYYVRNLDYANIKKGANIPLKVFLDGEAHPIKISYNGTTQTTIKGLGKFNSINVSPQLISGGTFKEGDRMDIWATNDGNRLPLLIQSPIQVGTVKCVLKSHSNLRHPLTSKM